jgi:hypothetical protein
MQQTSIFGSPRATRNEKWIATQNCIQSKDDGLAGFSGINMYWS